MTVFFFSTNLRFAVMVEPNITPCTTCGRAKRIEIAGSHFVVRPGGAGEHEREERERCGFHLTALHQNRSIRTVIRADTTNTAPPCPKTRWLPL